MAVINPECVKIIISEHECVTLALEYRLKMIFTTSKENLKMANNSNNKVMVPEAKAALEQFKMESANEVGVTLNKGYNGDLTSRQAGSIGGQMVKKMIEKYERDLAGK